jgi:hypothetical protein
MKMRWYIEDYMDPEITIEEDDEQAE